MLDSASNGRRYDHTRPDFLDSANLVPRSAGHFGFRRRHAGTEPRRHDDRPQYGLYLLSGPAPGIQLGKYTRLPYHRQSNSRSRIRYRHGLLPNTLDRGNSNTRSDSPRCFTSTVRCRCLSIPVAQPCLDKQIQTAIRSSSDDGSS